MKIFLVIENETVKEIVTKERGSWQLSDYEGSYDTIQEDPDGYFSVGDLYNYDEYLKYYPNPVNDEAAI